MDWFFSLSTLMQVFWGCAIISSVFFLLQTASTIVGIGAEEINVDADVSGHDGVLGEAMEMFTLRNMVNFFLGFGWTGVCLRGTIESDGVLVFAAVAIGLLFVALFVVILKKLLGLERSGNIDPIKDIVGKTADCYLRIPADGEGKIQMSVNGSVHEFNAVSDNDIPTGAKVKVVELVSQSTYKVIKI